MACRKDIEKIILDEVDQIFVDGRHTYYRLDDNTFRIANTAETAGKSKAKTRNQAREIALSLRQAIINKYGNNIFVQVSLPEESWLPIELTVTPTPQYIEKLYAQVKPEKRTEYVSREAFLQDEALYQQELREDEPINMIPYEAWAAQNRAPNPILDEEGKPKFDTALSENNLLVPKVEKGQYKLFQETNTAETLNALTSSPQTLQNLKKTTEYTLLEQNDENLTTKSGQAYVFLKEKDAERFSFLVNKHKEFPREFTVTQKVTKFEKDKSNPLNFRSYNEYKDLVYVKSNKNKKSNLYNIIDTSTGELIAEKVRVLHLAKDVKESIASKYGLEFTPTQVFSPDRSISFALYRQKPSKAKYVAQAKKYLYDALKFLNPEETSLKINLEEISKLLEAFPEGMWDYINTTYSPEDSTNINASINLQNSIKFKLPKLGLLTEIEKITGIKLQDASFKNYDRSNGIKKVLGVEWGEIVVIDYKSMTTKQLRKAISYYLQSINYFKPTSEQQNVRKYAEHNNIDYEKLKQLVFGDFDEALDNIAYNETGNSDTIELSKWRQSIREYDWQSVELFSKPYEDFYKRAKEKVKEKFKDKELANGISHLDYFFSGNFNWLNINFNNISGQYYMADMETEANVGVETKMGGIINPFEMKIYQKPKAGENFLQEKEVFNRLAAILHEPFHALHALAYGTKEELALRKAFNNLYNIDFGKEMMNQVFGSGYRGEGVSFDTLYKEFTAFATQLMLFPKEWITKTDLRSNDIYEFIEKVQTLQDKTYEEIVRTQQKIGTTEKVITEQEKIKLSFLEKLYNFVVSALNKVIPLSKKFFKTIADSKFVEKTVIEDVLGEVEEKFTKTIKLPKEVKESKEDFLSKMDDLKSAILTLMQIDETMFSPENINNFFTKPAFYQETGTVPIKPGVEELFDSNPTLANTVYEALGNTNTLNFTYGKRTGNLIDTIEKNKDICLFTQKATSDYLKRNNINSQPFILFKVQSPLTSNKIAHTLTIVKINDKTYFYDMPQSEFIKPTGNNVKQGTVDLVEGVFEKDYKPYLIEVNKENLINKYGISENDVTTNLETVERASKRLFNNKVELNEITPQQKQQAQQLYSQYLDTIFPDSKVKDIVYHGNKSEESRNNIIKNGFEIRKGFQEYGQGISVGDVSKLFYHGYSKNEGLSLIVNVKNPYVLKNEYFGEEKQNESKAFSDRLKKEGYDAVKVDNYEYTVFEPEQTHILGGKQDIEGFKEFVQTTTPELPPITEIPDVMATIIYQNQNCK